MVDVDVSVLNHLKKGLAWAVDIQLWVISTTFVGLCVGGSKRKSVLYMP